MVAFTYRMPAGVPGAVTRSSAATIEARPLDPTNYPTTFGVAVAIDATSKALRSITTGDAAEAVYGIYVRPFPTTGNGTDGLGTSTPPSSGIGNVLRRGYITVKLNGATASALDGAVYVRVAAAATGKPIGGFEAAADSTNTILLTNAIYTGPADANGNTEIAFNI